MKRNGEWRTTAGYDYFEFFFREVLFMAAQSGSRNSKNVKRKDRGLDPVREKKGSQLYGGLRDIIATRFGWTKILIVCYLVTKVNQVDLITKRETRDKIL